MGKHLTHCRVGQLVRGRITGKSYMPGGAMAFTKPRYGASPGISTTHCSQTRYRDPSFNLSPSDDTRVSRCITARFG